VLGVLEPAKNRMVLRKVHETWEKPPGPLLLADLCLAAHLGPDILAVFGQTVLGRLQTEAPCTLHPAPCTLEAIASNSD
jgi:hypothetical protein